MLQIERIKDAQSPDSSLPVWVSLDDDAIALFPEYSFSVHPEAIANDGQLIERAQGGLCGAPVGALPITSFPNGAPAFDARYAASSGQHYGHNPNPIPADNWSLFFAYQAQGPQTSTLLRVYGRASAPSGPANWMYVVMPSAREIVSLYTGSASGNTERIRVADIADRPFSASAPPRYVMITFSSDLGLKGYENGVLGREAPGDTAPLDGGLAGGVNQIFQAGTANTQLSKLIFSPLYHVNRDLSRPENSGFRAAIDSFMMRKYITS